MGLTEDGSGSSRTREGEPQLSGSRTSGLRAGRNRAHGNLLDSRRGRRHEFAERRADFADDILKHFKDGILKVASSNLAKWLKWTETLVAPQSTLLLSALMTLHAMETTTCELITREFDTKDAVRAVRRAHAGAAKLPVVLRLLRCTSGS